MRGGKWSRQPCPSCGRKCIFYCTACFLPVGAPKDAAVPRLKLPLQISIIFFDKIKKSTGVHARILAPESVELMQYPRQLPSLLPESTVVAFPAEDASTFEAMSLSELNSIERLVLIDTPWRKAKGILARDPRLAAARCVKLALPPSQSRFWRYHNEASGCVSTIEALHALLSEYDAAKHRVARDIGKVRPAPGMATENRSAIHTSTSASIPTSTGNPCSSSTGVSAPAPSRWDRLLFFFELIREQISAQHKASGDPRKPLPFEEAHKKWKRARVSFNAHKGSLHTRDGGKEDKATVAGRKRKLNVASTKDIPRTKQKASAGPDGVTRNSPRHISKQEP